MKIKLPTKDCFFPGLVLDIHGAVPFHHDARVILTLHHGPGMLRALKRDKNYLSENKYVNLRNCLFIQRTDISLSIHDKMAMDFCTCAYALFKILKI